MKEEEQRKRKSNERGRATKKEEQRKGKSNKRGRGRKNNKGGKSNWEDDEWGRAKCIKGENS